MSLRASGFPGCCGIAVLHDAGTGGEQFRKHLQRQIESSLIEYDEYQAGGGNEDVGMLLYTTIQSQKGTAKVLKEAGFKELSKTRNPKTGNRITLWGLPINQRKPKKPKTDPEEDEEGDIPFLQTQSMSPAATVVTSATSGVFVRRR